ncbi:aspartyl protease APCB1 isoform X2 [Aristolochia californica]|uniref:aspartyl protease APCB1 isoform X2 n=1 Tax=Aristolochia californica TaxID=171875 RepID=UPI0035DA78C9
MGDMDQPVKGVFIIALPPADDPSQGKTIIACALSGQHEFQLPQQHQQGGRPQARAPTVPRISSYVGRRLRRRIRIFGFLGVSVVALLIWAFFFSDSTFDLRDTSSDNESQLSSVIFPLYPKFTNVGPVQRDTELKLGRFVGRRDAAGRDKLKNRKRVRSASSVAMNSSIIFPVKGNVYPDGLYYTIVLIGNPPRPYYLDMDTGNALTWIQCDAPCTSCAQGPHPLYRPSRKNIVTTKESLCLEVQGVQNEAECESCEQCDYEVVYADQSSSIGVLARDELLAMFANETLAKSNLIFGCAYDQQGQLLVSPAKTDGILGLGKSAISLPSQLANQGLISNLVGHCIPPDVHGGGFLFLGDYQFPHHAMTWVPMINSPLKFYQAELKKISYGSKQLDVVGGRKNTARVIFDSGSSYTYLKQEAYTRLMDSFQDLSLEHFLRDKSDPTLPVCWVVNFSIGILAGRLKMSNGSLNL